jgi:tRNA threonylcarbamoyl adenosine modification protein YeaZ
VIVAFSTSSPLASVALIRADGTVLASGEELAPMRASGACLAILSGLLSSRGLRLEDAELFVADLGPGSFTGVKVGVTLAKTFAFTHKKLAAGARSFDLVDADGVVVLPSKRGEWFVRRPGNEPVRTEELPNEPFSGYGNGIENPVYPRAEGFTKLLDRLVAVEAERLAPEYLIEPSISKPKVPFQ